MNKNLPTNMKNKAVWHRSRQEGKKRGSSVSCHSFQGKKERIIFYLPMHRLQTCHLILRNETLICKLSFCSIRRDITWQNTIQRGEGREIVAAVKLRMNVELSCEWKICVQHTAWFLPEYLAPPKGPDMNL